VADITLPAPDGPAAFIWAHEAAAFLSIGEEKFDELVEQESEWLRGTEWGSPAKPRQKYRRSDIAVLAYLIAARGWLIRPEEE
jgi:hypothetical protein